MAKRFHPSSTAWWLVTVVPVILIALAVWPNLGQYEQGLLPQVLASETISDIFPQLAMRLRLWCGATLALACLAGLGFWISLRLRWRGLLRFFEPRRVLGYRGLVWGLRFVGSLLCGAVLGLALMAASSPTRALPAASWVVFVMSCAMAAGLQYASLVFGVGETRRLYLGR